MITVEHKLDIFNNIVYKEQEEKLIKELEELEAKNEEILNAKKIELEKNKQVFIKRKTALANILKNEMLSKYNDNKKVNTLAKREELLQDLIKSLVKKAEDYVQSKSYEDYFLNKLSNVITEIVDDEVLIIVTESDNIKLQNSIQKLAEKNKKTIVIESSKTDIIGGFILRNKNKTFNLDNSFKTIIEDNRYEIGKRLYTMLENVGETNE